MMSQEQGRRPTPDRREFLKRLAGTAAYATPIFVTAGARAESSAYERATLFLDRARDFVKAARSASSRESSMESLEAASLEVRQARSVARRTEGEEAELLQKRIRNLSTEIRQVERRNG